MFLSRRGFGTLEIVASLVIFGVVAQAATKIISAVKLDAYDEREALVHSIRQIDSIVAEEAMQRIRAYLYDFARLRKCQYSPDKSFNWTWDLSKIDPRKDDPIVAPGIEFQIYDKAHRHLVGPPKDRGRPLAQALARCEMRPTLYEASFPPPEDQSKVDVFYFCVLLRKHKCATRQDTHPGVLSAFDSSSPILIEFNFVLVPPTHFDKGQLGARHCCATYAEDLFNRRGRFMGVLQYKYYWDPATFSRKASKNVFLEFGGVYGAPLH